MLRPFVAVLVFGILAFALLRMTNLVSLRALAERNEFARSLSVALNDLGRHSLVWRLARDENHINVALQTPLLGSGQWNWWQNGDSRPWSLWLLVFGMYGLVGLIAFGAILLLPVFRAIWTPTKQYASGESNLRWAMAALILMVVIDNLVNGAMILPYLLITGGIATPRNSYRNSASSGRHANLIYSKIS
jgi:hypothetical protein